MRGGREGREGREKLPAGPPLCRGFHFFCHQPFEFQSSLQPEAPQKKNTSQRARTAVGYPVGIALDWCLEQVKRFFCGVPPIDEAVDLPSRSGGMGSILRSLGRCICPEPWPGIPRLGRWFPVNLDSPSDP